MQEFSEASDAQLVTSFGRYSEVALAEVYRRHGGAVYGLARRVLNNATEAEDVTQLARSRTLHCRNSTLRVGECKSRDEKCEPCLLTGNATLK
jgi:uncharacterized protein YcaQ